MIHRLSVEAVYCLLRRAPQNLMISCIIVRPAESPTSYHKFTKLPDIVSIVGHPMYEPVKIITLAIMLDA